MFKRPFPPHLMVAGLGRKPYNEGMSQRVTHEDLNFYRQVPMFVGLSDDELAALVADFMPRRFRQGETIFLQGDIGQTLYLIGQGQVRIYTQALSGQETSLVYYNAGDLFGELALIDELPRSASASAVTDTLVLMLGRERFRYHLRTLPQLSLNFMRALSVRMRYTNRQVDLLATLDVPGRLAAKLLELAQDYGQTQPDGVRIHLALTQSDLASFIGATRESINKTLGLFRRLRLIVQDGGYIIITDAEGLRGLVMGNEPLA